jgi:hypothetical protein
VDSVRKRNYYRFGSNPLAALSTLHYQLSTTISPLQGFGKMGEFLIRRLRFASPPVMHFTPLAGLRAKKLERLIFWKGQNIKQSVFFCETPRNVIRSRLNYL